MCGINGIFAYHSAATPLDRAELLRTRDHMAARGPDGAGEWISNDGRLGFGHRRLSIIDLSAAGTQPMADAKRSLVVTFNGEIYNFKSLRKELEAKGYNFVTNSDTEVLLHLYADRGERMVHALRGMFAFAIWDARQGTLFLARDPYGIKPLYYSDDGRTFRFASQVKALLAGGGLSRDPEPAGVVGFYLWGSVPEPFTCYKAISALPAGCSLLVHSARRGVPVQYHSIAEVYREAEVGEGSKVKDTVMLEELRAALQDSVAHHLVADVPVGAFLSAGIDSGALVGIMRDVGQSDLRTVTLAFEEFRGGRDDESVLAEEVARQYETRHTTRIVTQTEFESDLPRLLEAMDQPTIDGINSWFVAKAARELGLKVAVSGLGGDELFGGYPSFRDLPRWVNFFRPLNRTPGVARALGVVLRKITGHLHLSPKLAGLPELGGDYAGAYFLKRGLFMPWELCTVLDQDLVKAGLESVSAIKTPLAILDGGPNMPLAKVAVLESSIYMRNQLLRDTDWASMAHGLEVRTPLVDAVLLKTIASLFVNLPGTHWKKYLADAPSQPLPNHISSRPKTGFLTPTASWLQKSAINREIVSDVKRYEPRSRRLANLVAQYALDRACLAR